MNTALAHDTHLGFGGVVGPANDSPGVAHAAALGGGLPGDKAHDGLFNAWVLHVVGGFGFHAAADLTDHHDGFRFGVVHQEFDGFLSGGADDGVTTDADGRGLAQTRAG